MPPISFLPYTLFALLLAECALASAQDDSPPLKNLGIPDERPLVAIWRPYDTVPDSTGRFFYISLVVAIWQDGRVVFARDPYDGGHDLLEGRIPPYRIARLKTALADTGVFELKKTMFLTPSLTPSYTLVDLGEGQRQLLGWSSTKLACDSGDPRRLAFEDCWREVKNLALVACPDQRTAAKIRFRYTPDSWWLEDDAQAKKPSSPKALSPDS